MDRTAETLRQVTYGRFHAHDGFVFERTQDLEKPIRLGLAHGGDPLHPATRVVWCELSESEFASIVAHLARRGETGDTYRKALAFLQDTDTWPE